MIVSAFALLALLDLPPRFAERYRFPGTFVWSSRTVRDGQTTVERAEQTCAWASPVELACTTRDLGGQVPPMKTRSRVDATGLYLVAGEAGDFAYTHTPESLVLPADVRPGRTWTATYEETLTWAGVEPKRTPVSKRFEARASERCAAGLLVAAVEQRGARRIESELLYCPGQPPPIEASVRIFEGDRLRSSTVTTLEGATLRP